MFKSQKESLKKQWTIVKHQLVASYDRSGVRPKLDPIVAKYQMLPPEQKQLVMTGFVFLLIAINIFGVLSPSIKKIVVIKDKTQKMRNAVQSARLDISSVKVTEQAKQDTDDAIGERHNRVLLDKDVPSFLDKLSGIAKEANVNIEALKPISSIKVHKEDPRPIPKGYSYIGFQLNAEAGYHQIGKFVSLIEGNIISMRIAQLEIFHDSNSSKREHQFIIRIYVIRKDVKRK